MDEGGVEEDERRPEVESRISEWMKKCNEKARCACTYTSCQLLPGNTAEPKWQEQQASPLSSRKDLVWTTALWSREEQFDKQKLRFPETLSSVPSSR